MDKVFRYTFSFVVVYCLYFGLFTTLLSLFAKINMDKLQYCFFCAIAGSAIVNFIGLIIELRGDKYEDEDILDKF